MKVEEKKPSSAELCFCDGILAGGRDEPPNSRVAQKMIDKVVDWLLNMAEERTIREELVTLLAPDDELTVDVITLKNKLLGMVEEVEGS